MRADEDEGMILQVLADARKVGDDGDGVFGQMPARTDAGAHQDRRRMDRAAGQDDRPVTPQRAEKSISAEATFNTDLVAPAELQRALAQLADRTSSRLRGKGLLAGTVVVKIRQHDFTTVTRQHALPGPTQQTRVIAAAARHLLEQWCASHAGARVRLLGVGVGALSQSVQMPLFEGEAAAGHDRLDATADDIRARFGARALGRARGLE
jgi:DNA polymerase-4